MRRESVQTHNLREADETEAFTSCLQAARYPAMLRMVESGKLHPGKLVTGTVAIEEAAGALAGMGKFSTIGMTVITKW
jgi:alcohol dehydrogenase